MAFCSSCGSKLQDGDLFCGNCGATVNSESKNQDTFVKKPVVLKLQPSRNYLNELGSLFYNILLKPISTIKENIKTIDKNFSFIIVAILAVIQGLIIIWKTQQVYSTLETGLSKFIENINILFLGFMGKAVGTGSDLNDLQEMINGITKFKKMIKLPYGSMFFQGVMIFLVAIVVLYLSIYLTSNIMLKLEIEKMNLWKILIFSSIPFLTSEILAVLSCYATSYLGIAFLLLGALVSIGTVFISIREVMDLPQDKSIFIGAIALIIMIFIIALLLKMFIVSDIKNITSAIVNSFLKGEMNNLLR